MDELEENIDQLLVLCAQLRDENIELRRTIEQLNREQKKLAERQNKAREQLDVVIERVEQELKGQQS